MDLRGSWSSVAMGGVLITTIVAVVLLLGIPEVYGIYFNWGWRAVDRGHTELHALTPKIADFSSSDIFLAKGEELLATYDLELRTGRARMSVYTWGWLPAVGDLESFHQNTSIRSATRQRVSLVAPRPGFYRISGAIVDATGTFSIDWRVQNPQLSGQAVRFAGSVGGWFGLLIILVAAVAIAGVLIRLLAD